MILTMETLRAGALKLGLELSAQQMEQFQTFYRELIDWNRKFNLTAITGYEEVQTRHFLDSLSVLLACRSPAVDKGIRIIDVGTGAGLPGIPVKLVLPRTRLVLLDSTNKKGVFLQHLVQTLNLSDVAVVVGRAEEVAHQQPYRERFDVVLSRAVAALPALAELTLPFCAVGGCFIAQKKGAIETEVAQANIAITALGGRLRDVKRVELDQLNDDRYLVIVDKVSATPEEYPRRPGIPAKRPLIDKRIKQ